MLACICGYTCGTRAALDRHFAKFVDTADEGCHAQDFSRPLPRNAAARQTTFAATLSAPNTPSRPTSSSKLRGGIQETSAQKGADPDVVGWPSRSPRADGSYTPWRSSICMRDVGALPLSMVRLPATPTQSARARMGSAPLRPLASPAAQSLVPPSVPSFPPTPARRATINVQLYDPTSPKTPAQTTLAKAGLHTMRETPTQTSSPPLRLLLVRHAQSANKDRSRNQRPSPNPGLTDLGHEQATALGARLAHEFGSATRRQGLLVVSSPMRRCLLTILPAVRQLFLSSDSCLCHGACFEFGCCGSAYPGTTPDDIVAEFSEFHPIGFSAAGKWDYRGDNPKENEAECRRRGERIVEWLRGDAAAMLRARNLGDNASTIVLCIHQTVADLLCQLLIDGSAAEWAYGQIKYPLRNSSMTEIFLYPDGKAAFGNVDSFDHCYLLRRYSRSTTA
mmetsp:Transcript_117087/g.331373  ORF Transcript_117087/g.331373 Transcript_117087/m.331373 type:complete len:450 (-) Transcript_117087:146-1495(-)